MNLNLTLPPITMWPWYGKPMNAVRWATIVLNLKRHQ